MVAVWGAVLMAAPSPIERAHSVAFAALARTRGDMTMAVIRSAIVEYLRALAEDAELIDAKISAADLAAYVERTGAAP